MYMHLVQYKCTIYIYIYIYTYILMIYKIVLIYTCCAFVGLDNKLSKVNVIMSVTET
jgi:hypothetical protein